ncbi:polysaccharide deacetylase family protein [Dorea acetigenes]|uniref:Polysaccharide deacetylase family protein n=1 Tax=Dorea acetigenes TaxID=2981787 RepID=A0ABT2RMA7_9FIRM|nr:polysaccharide deacetylase family protein [Dorea acetigenes]MCB6414731.1 polysaccharide deacetylase family protein [Faecalimonas umbilicata]MCU6686540.1 polysaccharide deacetylase family protein [Dorea acetigenes]SCI99211.1 Probable polysaccharide deacetylase pdaA precursor [uncultured Clostridium sp.]
MKKYWKKILAYSLVLIVSLAVGGQTGFLMENADDVDGKVEPDIIRGEEFAEAAAYVSSSMVTEPPKIALTFDDGPSSSWTPILLDGLKERGVKATFFLIGENAKKNPDLVKRLDEEGHLIGNHTYHHVEITKVSNEAAYQEIMDADQEIYSITGKHTEYMRPPFGLWQRDLELELEVMPVMWTVDPLDWTTENVDEIVNKVVTEAEENDIILLHDCYKSSVEAALRIVDILAERGFEFVTVDELLMN